MSVSDIEEEMRENYEIELSSFSLVRVLTLTDYRMWLTSFIRLLRLCRSLFTALYSPCHELEYYEVVFVTVLRHCQYQGPLDYRSTNQASSLRLFFSLAIAP